MDISQAMLVIYKSPNGRDNWSVVPPAEVPEWVKDRDVMGRLVSGEACMKADEGEKGSDWFRAVSIEGHEQMMAAGAKRQQRARKRVMH